MGKRMKLLTLPQARYSFRLYDNVDKLTPAQIKAATGCWGLVNLAYFNMLTFAHDSALMVGGAWACEPKWHEWGICIDRAGRMTLGTEKEAVYDYAVALPPVCINGERYTGQYVAANGVTYTGLTARGDVVVLVSTKDEPMTSAQAETAMLEAGCVHIFRWDGSWSSQGILGGEEVKASKYRCCRSWLLIYENSDKKEDEPMGKKVVLDPGHGVETAGKRSPDGTYLEHEFNLDMAKRLKAQLERHGVSVTLTRSTEHDTTLVDRVSVANTIKPDLFVSLHSNASGEGWTDPSGYGIYTSSAGDTAGRNKAAMAILARAREAGIQLWGDGLHHDRLYVLRNTVSPAVIIEHGFHTNIHEVELLKTDVYRALLARVDAKGILDYLGIPWVNEPGVEAGVKPQQGQETAIVCPHCGGKLKIEKG